jgi:hypothetical protein
MDEVIRVLDRGELVGLIANVEAGRLSADLLIAAMEVRDRRFWPRVWQFFAG